MANNALIWLLCFLVGCESESVTEVNVAAVILGIISGLLLVAVGALVVVIVYIVRCVNSFPLLYNYYLLSSKHNEYR